MAAQGERPGLTNQGSISWEILPQPDQYGCHTARVTFSDLTTGAHVFIGQSRSRSKALANALVEAAQDIYERSKSATPEDIIKELER